VPARAEEREQHVVRTLAEAHAMLEARRPESDEGILAWVAHHRWCARVYAAVADTDPVYSAEASAWARIERREAQTLEENLIDLVATYLC
jgi:hypothetical protein